MSAILLAQIACVLVQRGHETRLTGDGELYVGEHLVARVHAERGPRRPVYVEVIAAQIFNGHTHVVPDECDTAIFFATKTAHRRAADAIEARQAARARSLPVPTDPTAIVRDPPEHECTEDNQGLCHNCGQVVNPGRWADFVGEEVSHAA